MTSKEWRTFNPKNGGPEPPTDAATLKNGALQLEDGAAEGHTNSDISKKYRYLEIHVQCVFSFFP